MSISQRVILLSGPEDDHPTEAQMRFRLTYEGELRPTQRDARDSASNPLAPHKHKVRRAFHHQLKHLWNTNKFLRETVVHPPDFSDIVLDGPFVPEGELPKTIPLVDAVASQYREFGYRFVPLVREDWQLLCSLDILFLRRDGPGRVIVAGDIDNRIKTLIDALRRPRAQNELVGSDAIPGPDEVPFFCLLEDDKQVSHLSVETDILLDPLTETNADTAMVKLFITVEFRPYYVTMFNSSFL